MSIQIEILLCVVLFGILSSGFTASIESKLEMKKSIENCEKELSFTCLKLEFLKLLERLMERREIDIFPGISLIQDTNVTLQKNTELIAEIARSFPKDPDQRLNVFIMTKIKNFLKSHSLKFKLLESDESSFKEFSGTARKGKFHKKGGMEALFAAGLMMKGTLMALGMGTLALLAGKALVVGLMALTLSTVIGLKSLASSGGKMTTYEVIAKPIYTSSHTHSVSHDDGGHQHGGHHSGHSGSGYGGSYGRSLNLDLPNHLKEPALR